PNRNNNNDCQRCSLCHCRVLFVQAPCPGMPRCGTTRCCDQQASKKGTMMNSFRQALEVQRWDDHRYYHHSRVNQALHLVSAGSFLCAYVLVFTSPAAAALVGWLLAMTSRQIGHFFFEPKGYDEVNQATHKYKEEVKVGYNLRRKVVLMTIWALSP